MTSLIRYRPTSLSLLDTIDGLFDGVFSDSLAFDGTRGVPAVDVRETEKGWEWKWTCRA